MAGDSATPGEFSNETSTPSPLPTRRIQPPKAAITIQRWSFGTLIGSGTGSPKVRLAPLCTHRQESRDLQRKAGGYSARSAHQNNGPRPAPSSRRCEKLARQAKPPAPPTLQTLAQQGRWGRRFRLPGRRSQFFTPRQRGDGFSGESVPALTLGVIRPPVNIPLEIVCSLPQCGAA